MKKNNNELAPSKTDAKVLLVAGVGAAVEYQKATEECRYEYIRIVEKTNCKDKKYGHKYEWIFKQHPEHDAIQKQFSKLYGAYCKCINCGKITSSM